jgi:hypothetical protein
MPFATASPVRRGGAALAIALTAALAVTACSTVDSGDLRTSGIDASFVVTAHEDAIEVLASLDAGGMTSVELKGRDRLVASSGGTSDDLDETSVFGNHAYSGQLKVRPRAGTEVTIELKRGPADTSTRSTVDLPASLTVTSPRENQKVRRARDLRFGINRASGDIEVAWAGACVLAGSMTFEEGAPVVIPAGTLQEPQQPSGQPRPPRTCDITWTLARVIRGSLGNGFDSGSITARRETGLVLASTR